MDNRRLILFLVFSFSLIMLWEAWHNPQSAANPTAATTAPGTVASGGKSEVPSPTPAGGSVTVPGTASATAPAAPAATSRMKVETDLMVADISAQGGDLVRLELTKHRAAEDKTKNFVLFDENHAYAAQSGLIGDGLPNHKTAWRLPAESMALKEGEDTLRVRLEADMGADAEGGGKVAKTYVFRRDSYPSRSNTSAPRPSRRVAMPISSWSGTASRPRATAR